MPTEPIIQGRRLSAAELVLIEAGLFQFLLTTTSTAACSADFTTSSNFALLMLALCRA